MITAHKMESENEEAHDKVRARSAMTTEPVEGTTEVGNQIAKLMASLTRPGQGNSPASAPNSPRQRDHGRGQMDRNTPGHPSSHNGWTGLGQTISACSTYVGHGTGTTTTGGQGPNTQGSKEGTSIRKDPSSLQCFRCQGWGHMVQECAIPAKTLKWSGENWGKVTQPPTSTSCNSQQWALSIPTLTPNQNWPQWKWLKRKDNQKSAHSFSQPWPHHPLGGTF